jgi:acyl-coenzyme A thioesterase PaaI-like protein
VIPVVIVRGSGQYVVVTSKAFQDQMVGNYCWGCGADNPTGLHLKTYWDDAVSVTQWTPDHAFAAGPRHFLNGGIIATVMDCHCVCTAIASAYQGEHRDIGTEPEIWYATASMSVDYLRPTPIDSTVQLRAKIVATEDRVTAVECVLGADGKDRARATVRAVRVPDDWRHGLNR